jgi:hypothetical protein
MPTKQPRKQSRYNAVERSQHVDMVYKMLLKGVHRQDILKYSAETWHLATRQTDERIREAKLRFNEAAKVNRVQELGLAVDRLDDIYRESWRVQDYRTALAAQRERIALLHLDRPNPPPSAPITAKTPADLMAVISAALTELAALPTDPGKSQAIANLTRAALSVNENVILEQRIAALEGQANGSQL